MGTNQLAAEDPKDCSLACTTHHHVRYYGVLYHRVENSINLQLHIPHVLTYFKLVDLFVLLMPSRAYVQKISRSNYCLQCYLSNFGYAAQSIQVTYAQLLCIIYSCTRCR